MWPTRKEDHEYLRERQRQNRVLAVKNPNENWMLEKLRASGRKWTRQAIWGYRIFDFWCAEVGIAVEVDGPEHNRERDRIRDERNYWTSGIVVLRVRNRNEEDAARCLKAIAEARSWNARRAHLALPPIR